MKYWLALIDCGTVRCILAIGRASSDDNRQMSLSIATASGSAGQIIGPPAAIALLSLMEWQMVFIVFAASILSVLVLLPFMKAPEMATKDEIEETLGDILKLASRYTSFAMIFIGFLHAVTNWHLLQHTFQL